MKCWASTQKLVEVYVDTKTKELVRNDKLAEAQFKADLGTVLIENRTEIEVADYYLATGIILEKGAATILPAAPSK